MSSEEMIISKVADQIKSQFINHESSHDWWHIYRVWRNVQYLNHREGGDRLIVELAALLHDVADWKFNDGDLTAGPKAAQALLDQHNVSSEVIKRVVDIVSEVTFKGAKVDTTPSTLEGMIVQDADRLDAIGAIGVARAFAFGGSKDRLLYEPESKPLLHKSFDEYKNAKSSTINHFYEKLLLLKDKMNTQTAKELAVERHEFMELFLQNFYKEWEINGSTKS